MYDPNFLAAVMKSLPELSNEQQAYWAASSTELRERLQRLSIIPFQLLINICNERLNEPMISSINEVQKKCGEIRLTIGRSAHACISDELDQASAAMKIKLPVIFISCGKYPKGSLPHGLIVIRAQHILRRLPKVLEPMVSAHFAKQEAQIS